MRYLKILSLVVLSLVLMTACKNKDNNKGDRDAVEGEWALVSWNEETPEFSVYISFAADGSFAIYQQVWSLDYELFTGTFTVSGDTLKGTYADGTKWASEYKFVKSDNTLTLVDSADVTGVYEKCTIPEEIIAEATTTRSEEVVPFL
mgnify:FL=1